MDAANWAAVLLSVPISYHFHGCTALLVTLVVVSGAILNTHLYLLPFTENWMAYWVDTQFVPSVFLVYLSVQQCCVKQLWIDLKKLRERKKNQRNEEVINIWNWSSWFGSGSGSCCYDSGPLSQRAAIAKIRTCRTVCMLLSNALQHVPICLQPFFINSTRKFKSSPFSTFLAHFGLPWVYASGTIAVNVTWMERGFTIAYQRLTDRRTDRQTSSLYQ